MQFGDLFCERKPQAVAVIIVFFAGGICAVKSVKNIANIFFGNALAFVLHANALFAAFAKNTHYYVAFGWAVFCGVIKQNNQKLGDAFLVEARFTGFFTGRNGYAFLLMFWQRFDRFFGERLQICVFPFKRIIFMLR